MSEPGLDLTTLRGLARPRHGSAALVGQIRHHLDEHDGYVAVSGGKDSLVLLDLALQADRNVPVVFFDSGLEFPETVAYLDELESHFDITIHTYPARPSLLELLVADGSWSHQGTTYGASGPSLKDTLILEPSRAAHRDHGPGELWGVRAAESRGRDWLYRRALARETAGCRCPSAADRLLHHGGRVRRADGTVAYSPLWNWTTSDVWAHIARRRLPVNPIYSKLQRLGANERDLRVTSVIDAEHLERGRVAWLRRGWPQIYAQLLPLLPRLAEFV